MGISPRAKYLTPVKRMNIIPSIPLPTLPRTHFVPMMAFNRTPESPALDPTTVEELRAALTLSIKTGTHDDALKGVLSRAAADARKKGMLAEQLLLVLKDIWYALPEISSRTGNDAQTRLLQQLIARCIQEYYA